MSSKNTFSSTWLNMRESYDSDVRTKKIRKCIKGNDKILDLGSGTGSFLRWCIRNDIFFNEILMIDYDEKLLQKVQSITNKFCKYNNLELKKSSPKKFVLISKKNSKSISISMKRNDLSSCNKILKDYDVLNFSAVTDILSKKYFINLFKNIIKNQTIFFNICFNGQIKWNKKNKYDKYIIYHFNQDQETYKGDDLALGHKSIKLINELSKKYDFSINTYDSSWNLHSNTDSKDFHLKYLKTIYKPLLKKDDIDVDILKSWYKEKLSLVEIGKLVTKVGHNDIIIKS